MAIQSNFPAIRPSLLLDFANSKRLDPRITFTRASTACYYDGSTVAKAEENLLLRSQDYSATWTVTDLTPVTSKTAPDGTSTATEFTASGANGTLTQSVTAVAADYTFSVWLRRVTGTGNIDISAHSAGTWVTQTISGTWARYTVTQTLTAGARTPGIRVVTSGDAIEVWGAQLEQRSAVTAYTATTTAQITNYVPQLLTAASGVPRFDHTPTTGESLGLLIEEARTNRIANSQNFTASGWTNYNATVNTNTVIAPDGTLTATELLATSTNAVHSVMYTDSDSSSGTTYTRSVYAKAGRSNFVLLQRSTSPGTSSAWGVVNLATGAFTNNSLINLTVTAVGNGWYRISFPQSAVSTSTNRLNIAVGNAFSTAVPTFAGTGAESVYIWGAQYEVGDFATSYIATSGSTATRQADAASMTGTNFSSWYDAAEGTVYGEFTPLVLNAGAGVSINDNTANNRIRVAMTSTSEQGSVAVNNTAQATLDGGTPAVGTTQRIAMAYKVNDFSLSLAGGAVATDTSGTIPVVSQMNIGATPSTSGSVQIRKVAYYPLRVTDAQLVALTG